MFGFSWIQIAAIVGVAALLIGPRCGSIATAIKAAAGKFSFRPAQPAATTAGVDFVDAFLLVKPRITAPEAASLWARLEPASPTLETIAIQPTQAEAAS